MDPQEERYFKKQIDKVKALNDIEIARQEENSPGKQIPYYLEGRRSSKQIDPVYLNGRLIQNQWGQKRVYADWKIADTQSSLFHCSQNIQSFNQWDLQQ